MGKISLKRTLNPENCKKVAEQKSSASCEKIVEPKVTMYDLDSLLDTSKDNHHVVPDEMKAKWDEILSVFDTPNESVEPEQKVEISPEKHKSSYKGYTSTRATANRNWEKQQARINLRMAPDLKTALDTHAKSRGESTMGFIIRAIKKQIERDNAE